MLDISRNTDMKTVMKMEGNLCEHQMFDLNR